MQTTLRLEFYRQAKAWAAALGISLPRFLEEPSGSDSRRRRPDRMAEGFVLPVSTAGGGLASDSRRSKKAVAAADLADDRRKAR